MSKKKGKRGADTSSQPPSSAAVPNPPSGKRAELVDEQVGVFARQTNGG